METSLAGVKNGRLGGLVLTITPTLKTTAYSTGQQIGGVMEIKDAIQTPDGGALLDSLSVIDLDNNKSQMDFFLFSQLPTPVSSDGVAVSISTADMANCLGVISVAGADYVTMTASGAAAAAAASEKNLKLGLRNDTPASTNASPLQYGNQNYSSVWCVAVIRATATYTNGLRYKFGIV